MFCRPHHFSRGEVGAVSDGGDHLPQVVGSDVDLGDEQTLGIEGGELHLNNHDQDRDMLTNTGDSRDEQNYSICELDGEQVSDTKVYPIPGDEEERI